MPTIEPVAVTPPPVLAEQPPGPEEDELLEFDLLEDDELEEDVFDEEDEDGGGP